MGREEYVDRKGSTFELSILCLVFIEETSDEDSLARYAMLCYTDLCYVKVHSVGGKSKWYLERRLDAICIAFELEQGK